MQQRHLCTAEAIQVLRLGEGNSIWLVGNPGHAQPDQERTQNLILKGTRESHSLYWNCPKCRHWPALLQFQNSFSHLHSQMIQKEGTKYSVVNIFKRCMWETVEFLIFLLQFPHTSQGYTSIDYQPHYEKQERCEILPGNGHHTQTS